MSEINDAGMPDGPVSPEILRPADPNGDTDTYGDVPPGGARLGPGSLTWKYAADQRLYLLLGTIGSLQNMHPAVSAGVTDHSKIFTGPFDRLRRSVPPVMDVIFAPPHQEWGVTLRDFHKEIKGTMADGERYHALDPEVFWFTHVTFVEAVVFSARHLYHHELTAQEREQLIRESVTWWSRYGMSMRPVVYTWADYERYIDTVCRDTLDLTPIMEWSLRGVGSTRFDRQLGIPAPIFRLLAKIGHQIGAAPQYSSQCPSTTEMFSESIRAA